MVSIETVEAAAQQGYAALDALLLPTYSALQHWPQVSVSEAAAYYLKQGQSVVIPKSPTQGLVCLYSKNGEFLGIGTVADDGKVQPKRLVS
jgi:tRNA pseudouridine55 synthase